MFYLKKVQYVFKYVIYIADMRVITNFFHVEVAFFSPFKEFCSVSGIS